MFWRYRREGPDAMRLVFQALRAKFREPPVRAWLIEQRARGWPCPLVRLAELKPDIRERTAR
eukprot:198947-Alexandrium_andersonii.AAC.1